MPRKFDLVEVPELILVLGPDDEGTFPVSADCGDAHWNRERARIAAERAEAGAKNVGSFTRKFQDRDPAGDVIPPAGRVGTYRQKFSANDPPRMAKTHGNPLERLRYRGKYGE